MWRGGGGGRSSALERAEQALLSARSRRGDAQASTTKTQSSVDSAGSLKPRSAPPNTHALMYDLSDLSSVSSASEPRGHAGRSVNPENGYERGDSNKDARPQSSLGGRSRFLKKAPPPTTSSQSPVSSNQVHEPSYVSSSQRGSSQTTALSRLAEIESRIHSRKQAQEQVRQGTKPAYDFNTDTRLSPPPLAPTNLPTKSSSDQSPRENRFLKKKTTSAIEGTNAASAAPKSADVSVRSRACNAVDLSRETKSLRIMNTVSLESDEEDMRKLLGDSFDSTGCSLIRPEKPSSMKKPKKKFSKSSQRVPSTPPPAAVRPPSPSVMAPPHSPSSPSRRSSPFRFTGLAQAHFSPSMLSPAPSLPGVSPTPPLEGPGSSPRVESPGSSISSVSGRGEVLSLEELFPVGPISEDLHSEMSSVSEDFRINVMTLDDLVPADTGFTAETSGAKRETKHGSPGSESQAVEESEEKEVVDYQSDFENERTEPDYSFSQVSEHLQGYEEKEVSEVIEKDSDVSHENTKDDYSSDFSDTSHTCTSRTSDHKSSSSSKSRDSRSSGSHRSCASSQWSMRRDPDRKKGLKDAAVQTQPATYTWSTGSAYLNPTHTVSKERMEAISTFNPALFTHNELLKQQLDMTRRFIESSRLLHSRLMQSLEPPNYRYTTLEDTKEYIRRHTHPKLTMEKAIEELLQETRRCHCT
ncbi:uncharacterized protein C19orf44 homolog [Parambassis ranga]|uniref:Uncharacterized protein C19orf44 homolog n=1 Tax=Parambassis ranga TaxID=210632 RepID=A0A6P7HVF7_9TELE|nr:uncharacterized protein C19orf44 homolog [Parambassis ranga]